MKKAFGEYRLLTGSARTRGSLWEGPDHLLYIESEGFLMELTESYRRIDYSKIQAITFGRTRTWAITIAWQVLLAALFAWPIIYFFSVNGYRYIDPVSAPLAVIAGLALVVMLVVLISNLIKGPTCTCKVQTAVQSLRLKPVVRMKQARQLAQRLTVLCLNHQEAVPLASGIHPDSEGASGNRAESTSAFAPLLQTKAPFTGSRLMRWGFLLLLVAGGLTAGEVFVDGLPYFVADVLLASTAGIMLVAALLRNTRVDLPPTLKGTLWAATINYAFSMVLAFGIYMYGTIIFAEKMARTRRGPSFPSNIRNDLFSWMAHAGFAELQWCAWLVIGVGGLNVVLALLGLPSVLRSRASVIATPPPIADSMLSKTAPGAAVAPTPLVSESPIAGYEPPSAS